MIDETKVKEIFINIISNAVKYTPAGGKITAEIKELPSESIGQALYRTTVTDNGIGMSADFLPHLFEDFEREHTSTESRVAGTGLGMPIVKKLVEIMKLPLVLIMVEWFDSQKVKFVLWVEVVLVLRVLI